MPVSVCRKVKPDRPVFDPTETNPQGSRQDFAWMKVVTEAYCDARRGVHGPLVSATKSNLMDQCLTLKKLTLKEAGRILPGQNLSQRLTVMLRGVYMAHDCLPQSQT